MERLSGKIAIITGAAGGIGRAAAELFAKEGAKVFLVDLSDEALAEVARVIGPSAGFQAADVSDEEQVKGYVQACVARFGGVDVLFDNAGIEGHVGALIEQTEAEFKRVLGVNLLGVWFGIKHTAPEMAKRGGGSIVVTSSVAGLVGAVGLGPYIASKHAVMGLVKTAAQELAPLNIRVNAVNPGPIANRMMDSVETQANPAHPEQVHAGFEQRVPMKRYGKNEEVAQVALFLASDESSYCNGAPFLVDGGYVAV